MIKSGSSILFNSTFETTRTGLAKTYLYPFEVNSFITFSPSFNFPSKESATHFLIYLI